MNLIKLRVVAKDNKIILQQAMPFMKQWLIWQDIPSERGTYDKKNNNG